jgi:outer membrane protein, adhesin transport system
MNSPSAANFLSGTRLLQLPTLPFSPDRSLLCATALVAGTFAPIQPVLAATPDSFSVAFAELRPQPGQSPRDNRASFREAASANASPATHPAASSNASNPPEDLDAIIFAAGYAALVNFASPGPRAAPAPHSTPANALGRNAPRSPVAGELPALAQPTSTSAASADEFGTAFGQVQPETARSAAVPSAVEQPPTAPVTAPTLPEPIERPLLIDRANDPVLTLANRAGDTGDFRAFVQDAIRLHPSLDEAEALAREAREMKDEARSALYPTVDLGVTSYRVIDQNFREELDNLLQRARPDSRTDFTGSVEQRLFDFGATADRIASAESRIQAALADVDNTVAQVALNTIGAWYELYTSRVLLDLTLVYRDNVVAAGEALQQRVDQGQSAPTDRSRIDSALAALDIRAARYVRDVTNAEARFFELTGRSAPASLDRVPLLGTLPVTAEGARLDAETMPVVRSARAQATAADKAAEAAREDTLPLLTGQIVAGRYGVFEVAQDYDVRVFVNARVQLFGPGDARADQARARSDAAFARSVRVREEAGRDAAIAFGDLAALDTQLAAFENAYLAARTTRDATLLRFRSSRGSIFDVLTTNDTYFATAATYIDGLAQRDIAHYLLLARTGRMLDAFEVRPTTEMMLKR